MGQERIKRAEEIIQANTAHGSEAGFGMCTLSLIDGEGYPTASIVTPCKAGGIEWVTFGTMLDGNRAKRAAGCGKASVCFSTAEYCVNLVGDIEVLTGEAVKREMWYDGLAYHFTGPEDDNYCVLRFATKRFKLFLDGAEEEGTL